MNPIWFNALLIQGMIALVAITIGVYRFRIKVGHAIIAVGLMCPVPIFLVSPGIAGAVFVGDIIGCYALIIWLLRPTPGSREALIDKRVLYLAVTTLVMLPAVSGLIGQVMGWVNYKFLLLGLARGFIYVALFRLVALNILDIAQSVNLLMVQIFMWVFYCLFGLASYFGFLELDAWNSTRGTLEAATQYTDGFGGGFMGLYRGAVGALCVSMCAVAAVLLPTLRRGYFLVSAFMAISIVIVMCSGSRQGLFISLLAIILGLISFTKIKNKTNFTRVAISLISILIVSLIVILPIWQQVTPPKAKRYFKDRFGDYSNIGQIFADAKVRDPKMPFALNNSFSNPLRILIGTGVGSTEYVSTEARAISYYVDSELLMQLQTTGVIGLLLYIILLGSLIWSLHGYRKLFSSQDQLIVAAAFVAVTVGTLLTYGHFFLATTLSHQAPISLWLWSLLGGGHGLMRADRGADNYEY